MQNFKYYFSLASIKFCCNHKSAFLLIKPFLEILLQCNEIFQIKFFVENNVAIFVASIQIIIFYSKVWNFTVKRGKKNFF